MAEFIGSRISLVSKSDIRYVGTLVEINSELSTVALENVSSYGTEGRMQRPEDEIPPSDSTYDYIVFRGSDVKDLRIEESAPSKENQPPIAQDPAIMSASRPAPQQAKNQAQAPGPAPGPSPQQAPGMPQGPGGPPFNMQGPPGNFYPPPPPQGWGRGGPMPPPGAPGFPPMPYGAPPPQWYYPPGPGGFPPPPGPGHPGAPGGFGFNPYGPFPPGPPGPPQQPSAALKAPSATSGHSAANTPPIEPKSLGAPAQELPAATHTQQPAQSSAAPQQAPKVPTEPRNAQKIVPALPLPSPPKQPASKTLGPNGLPMRSAHEDATEAAAAAVAAAMAKLPPIRNQPNQQQNGGRRPQHQHSTSGGIDNLTKKVSEMRTNDAAVRAPRHPSAQGAGFNNRGGGAAGAARGRGGGPRPEPRKVEVPKTDFDFESSNAKFNKQDLVKEAIAGSNVGEIAGTAHEEGDEVSVPASSYNKKSSFFDDLSSEAKDRADGHERVSGRQWRGEEQKRNVETFGQGSVDNNYRGGYRGRGRGRGRGGRGRGGGFNQISGGSAAQQ